MSKFLIRGCAILHETVVDSVRVPRRSGAQYRAIWGSVQGFCG
jgi:hypothetical protein